MMDIYIHVHTRCPPLSPIHASTAIAHNILAVMEYT